MQNLTDQEVWYVNYKAREGNSQLEYLFFTLKTSQKMLIDYYEVILMNCIYKTNRYKMLLLIIIEVTALNITFYTTFCFMKGENYTDYNWVMQTLKWLYNHLNLLYSETVLSDSDKVLAPALYYIFSDSEYQVNHALCVWHMNNNIITNCKKLFSTNELYDKFIKWWKTLHLTVTLDLLKESYNMFYHIYLEIDMRICMYIEEHVWLLHTKWAKFYTDQFLHFNNIFLTVRGCSPSSQAATSYFHWWVLNLLYNSSTNLSRWSKDSEE